MKIKIDSKKIITEINLNIKLEGFEIETFKNLFYLAEARIRDKYPYQGDYQMEVNMIRKLQKELE